MNFLIFFDDLYHPNDNRFFLSTKVFYTNDKYTIDQPLREFWLGLRLKLIEGVVFLRE